MRKNKKLIVIVSLAIILILTGVIGFIFSPKNIVSQKASASLEYLVYEDEAIKVDEAQVMGILKKYKAQRSLKSFFPYFTDDIKIQMIIDDNGRSKHFLLGEFNIWYEASKSHAYVIKDADKLMEELKLVIEE
ncbi:MAG: hypothetical protein GX829_00770 [Clostridium sp.]|nr:hypothetical protein [Clostridium sp.]